jgi:hypothetical protein
MAEVPRTPHAVRSGLEKISVSSFSTRKERRKMCVKRKRWFLLAVFAATVGLASLLALSGPVKLRAQDNGQGGVQTWTFSVVNGETAPGTDRILLNGAGNFNPQGGASGSGAFTLFNPTAPHPPISFGTFEVTGGLQSFTPTTPPTYGAHAGGVIIMIVDLHPKGQPVIKGATMKVV